MANSNRSNNKKVYKNRKGRSNNARNNASTEIRANGGSNPNKYSTNSASDDKIKQIVGSIQFPPYIGVPLDAFASATEHPKHGIPTVCEIPFMATYGDAHGVPTDTLNTAAIHLHSMIMSKLNRATKAYDANDLMVACICCDSIITVYNYFKTMVSQVMTYTSNNRALPRVIVEAMGFDFDDVKNNINDLKVYLEMYAAKLNSLQIPKVMDVSDDHMYLTGNLFCDVDSVYPQIYVFRLCNYYLFDQTSEPGKTIAFCKNLGAVPTSGEKWKTTNIIQVLDDMYNSLFTSYDFGNILADLRTAIPDAEIILTNPTFDAITPVYDKNILMALHNATPCASIDALSLSVKSAVDSNYAAVLEIKPEIYVKSYGYSGRVFMDLTPEYQNPDGIYDITRWMVTPFDEEQVAQGDTVIQGEWHREPVSVYVEAPNTAIGTEILWCPVIHFPAYDKSNPTKVVDVRFYLRHAGGDLLEGFTYSTLSLDHAHELAYVYSLFDYLPLIPCINYRLESGVYHFDSTPQHVIGLRDAVTTITPEQIKKIQAYRIMNKLLKFTS